MSFSTPSSRSLITFFPFHTESQPVSSITFPHLRPPPLQHRGILATIRIFCLILFSVMFENIHVSIAHVQRETNRQTRHARRVERHNGAADTPGAAACLQSHETPLWMRDYQFPLRTSRVVQYRWEGLRRSPLMEVLAEYAQLRKPSLTESSTSGYYLMFSSFLLPAVTEPLTATK